MAKSRFAIVPHEVLTDSRLSLADRIVFAGLSSEIRRQGVNIVSWRNTELAELLHVSTRQIARSLRQLAKCGHLSRALNKINARPTFNLHSAAFQEPRKKLVSMPKIAAKSGH